jgi:hypothetical protein
MLLLLQGWVPPLGYGLLFLALVCFGAAFALGRRDQKREPPSPPFQQ